MLRPNGVRAICGFAGCGKSTVVKAGLLPEEEPMTYRWIETAAGEKVQNPAWPKNYCEALIAIALQHEGVILASSHPEVLEYLINRDVEVFLVYPDETQKEVYRRRYRERKNPEKLVTFFYDNFDGWVENARVQTGCRHFVIGPEEHLSDVLQYILLG